MTDRTTKVVIDTAIAEASINLSKANDNLDRLDRQADRQARSRGGEEFRADHGDEFRAARLAITAARQLLQEVALQYEGWSRFFLVQNSGGHIHRDMSCGTCFPTTQYAWLTELSGLTEADAVDEYGEILCSVCYPSAPVAWTMGKNKKDEARKQLDRDLRAIAKSPEGKRVSSAQDLVKSKTYRIKRHEDVLVRLANDLAHGEEPVEWVQRDAERANAELPKIRKQLARAEDKLAAAVAALNEALENA